jgi:hypothetical protein
MSPKLHQLLAVEKDIKGQATLKKVQIIDTFTRPELFEGFQRKYQSILDEGDDQLPGEVKNIQGIVNNLLQDYMSNQCQLVDLIFQKELSNLNAKADLKLSDSLVFENLPVQFLVQLENLFKDILITFKKLPMLDPAEKWEEDKTRNNIYMTAEKKTIRTKKIQQPIVLHEGDAHHPPQTQLISIDKTTGHWVTTKFSGAITPSEKERLVSNCMTVLLKIKRAKSSANDIPIVKKEIGRSILEYVLNSNKE